MSGNYFMQFILLSLLAVILIPLIVLVLRQLPSA